MYKLLITLFIALSIYATAKENTYVFEAKGEFAKELKSLVEKYSKEGKVDVKVYEGNLKPEKESKTLTQSIISNMQGNTAESLKYADVEKGEILYKKLCMGCHGSKADENKYAGIRKLSDINSLEIVEVLNDYKNEDDFGGSMKVIMKPQADNLTEEEIQSVAVYIYSLNHDTKLPISENSTQVAEEKEVPSSYLQ